MTATKRAPSSSLAEGCARLLVILSAINVVGCAINLKETSSGPTGCESHDIEIYDDSGGLLTRTWKARCGYTHYQCSAAGRDTGIPFVIDMIGTSCTAIGSTRPSLASTPRLAPRVVARKDAEERRTFTSVMRQGPFHFVLYGVPELNPDRVAFYVELPADLAAEACGVSFVVDDEPLPVEDFHFRVEKQDRLKVLLQTQTVRQMARATRAGGVICERPWSLGEAGQRTLRAFAAAFDSEVKATQRRSANVATRAHLTD